MKVVIKNNRDLGIGEIFNIVEIPVLHFKVLFQRSPIKVFYPNEIERYAIPPGTIVKTRYGTGKVEGKGKDDEEGYHFYKVKFKGSIATKILKENSIIKLIPGIQEGINDVSTSVIDIHKQGLFLCAYYFNFVLPTDKNFQAICHGRMEAFPYQISVINQVLGTYPSRFLLCDEVGLGKTIEAAAVLKELVLRRIVHRAIIIVPASLVSQWKFELDSKFNLDFEIYDGTRVKSLKINYPGTNPYTLNRFILMSMQFARRDENRKLMDQVQFDFAIFDEAHHLRRYFNAKGGHKNTKNYELGENICNKTKLVLLLTATPMQLNPFELFSLVKLVDPTMFPKYADFIEFKEKISQYNLILRNLDIFPKLNVFEKRYMVNAISGILGNDDWDFNDKSIQNALYTRDNALKNKILNKLKDEHLLLQVLIRNKKRHVFKGKLPVRKIKIVLIEPTEAELHVYNDIRLYITKVYQRSMEEKNSATGFVMVIFQKLLASSHYAIRETIHKRIGKLREMQVKFMKQKAELENQRLEMDEDEYNKKIKVLSTRIDNVDEDVPLLNDYFEKLKALKEDSKAFALVNLIRDFINREPRGKLIIFTQFMRTLKYLKSFIENNVNGVKIGTFHGKLTKSEKDKEVEKFKLEARAPYIFISTEAGGEGRNFQFCHTMVNYDLPWNPMKLEQRIGRIDRIGQVEDVRVFNFALKGTIEERIVRILSERIFTFQELIGELEPILIDFDSDLENLILTSGDENELEIKFQVLDDRLGHTLELVKHNRVAMQDILMEIKTRHALADDTLSCSIDLNYGNLLKKFALTVLKDTKNNAGKAPLAGEEITKNVYKFQNSRDGKEYIGTFDRNVALEYERLDFFNLGHELINTLIKYSLKEGVSHKIGVMQVKVGDLTTKLNVEIPPGTKPVSRLFLTCNVVDKTGVENIRELIFKLYTLDETNGDIHFLSNVGNIVALEFLLSTTTGAGDTVADGLKLTREWLETGEKSMQTLKNLIRMNSLEVSNSIKGELKEWTKFNESEYLKMKERELHFYQYHERKLKDEYSNLTFKINQETHATGKMDSKKIANLEEKRNQIERQLDELQVGFEGKITEMREGLNRLDITHSILSISVIVMDQK
ncbi:MAG: DEAD/DEAH box helicase [Promethearchaeota archaeon]